MLDSYVSVSPNFNNINNNNNNTDYEARFFESLKLLHTPKWLNNETVNYQNQQHTSLYNTKNKYDRLKQRFKTSSKPEQQQQQQPPIRSKSK